MGAALRSPRALGSRRASGSPGALGWRRASRSPRALGLQRALGSRRAPRSPRAWPRRAGVLLLCLLVPAITGLATASATAPPRPGAAHTAAAPPAPGAHTAAAPPAPGAHTAAAPPAPGARTAALIEESSGQLLYGLNADARVPIASTTKLMTALVTLHHARLRDMFTEPNYYPASEYSQIGLVPGERMSVHDLLIALMLPSADDAAEDLAYNIGHGSVSRFVAMMNARARELHLTHTHYTTPIGLDTPGNYSSASDLVKLARYVLRSEPFVKAVVSKKTAVLRTGNHVRHVTNLNDLVAHYSWINGVKTGHTLDAGYVLVASGTRGGMTLIGVVLGTASEAARDASALALLDYGFANYRIETPVHAGEVMAWPHVKGQTTQRARLIAASTYSHVFLRSSPVRVRVRAPAQLTGPLPAHAVIGSAVVTAGGKVQARIPLLLDQALPKLNSSSKTALKRAVVLSATLSGLVLAVGAAIGLRLFWRGSQRG